MKRNMIQKAICLTSAIGVMAIIALLIGGIVLGVKSLSKKDNAELKQEPTVQKILSVLDVRDYLLPASELVTMKDSFSVTESYEKSHQLFGHKVPLTTDETFLSFTCTIGIGFDLSDTEISVDNDKHRVEITLSEPCVVYNEIDPDSVYIKSVKNSIFTKTEAEDVLEVEALFQQNAVDEHLADGSVYREATYHAQDVLFDVLDSAGVTDEYTVQFH